MTPSFLLRFKKINNYLLIITPKTLSYVVKVFKRIESGFLLFFEKREGKNYLSYLSFYTCVKRTIPPIFKKNY